LGSIFLCFYLFVGGRGTVSPDSISNMSLACSIVRDFDSTFTPEEAPALFRWKVVHGKQSQEVLLTRIDPSTRALWDAGRIELIGPNYLAVDSKLPGRYASTFPPGASWLAVPVYAAVSVVVGDVADRPRLMWAIGRLIAASTAAISAVFVFATCRLITSSSVSVLLAIGYALGTSVWTTSSQGLWQHGPAEMFAAWAIFLWASSHQPVRYAGMIGVLLGAATVCRITYAALVIGVGLHLLWSDRRGLLAYLAGGLPMAIFLAAYNEACFGSPFLMGEALVPNHALEKTGSDAVFSTPAWLGLSTSLISPNRGLWVFSPMLALGLLGWLVSGEGRRQAWVQTLVFSAVLMTLIQATYFDYWGGWCFGNRNLVDTVVVWMPAIAWGFDRWSRPLARAALVLTIGWGVTLQMCGALLYTPESWNGRTLYRIGPLERDSWITHDRQMAEEKGARDGLPIEEIEGNIDLPLNRHRLWSVQDSQIKVLIEQLRNRESVVTFADEFLLSRREDKMRNHARLAFAFDQVGDVDEADRQRSLAASVP
jgi:hypothetical protein